MRRPRIQISPAVGADEAADQVQRRRLAAAGGAEQAEELAVADLQVEALERKLAP